MLACHEVLSVSLPRLELLVNVVLVAEPGACTIAGMRCVGSFWGPRQGRSTASSDLCAQG